jgi:hypothetical protein
VLIQMERLDKARCPLKTCPSPPSPLSPGKHARERYAQLGPQLGAYGMIDTDGERISPSYERCKHTCKTESLDFGLDGISFIPPGLRCVRRVGPVSDVHRQRETQRSGLLELAFPIGVNCASGRRRM